MLHLQLMFSVRIPEINFELKNAVLWDVTQCGSYKN
jgi:hypothetical protein